jgi:hypothetical protein
MSWWNRKKKTMGLLVRTLIVGDARELVLTVEDDSGSTWSARCAPEQAGRLGDELLRAAAQAVAGREREA